MRVYMLVIIPVPKTIPFHLPKDVGNNLKHEADSVINCNKNWAEHKERKRSANYCPNKSLEMILINTVNSKTNGPHKFVLNLSQRLNLKSLN